MRQLIKNDFSVRLSNRFFFLILAINNVNSI